MSSVNKILISRPALRKVCVNFLPTHPLFSHPFLPESPVKRIGAYNHPFPTPYPPPGIPLLSWHSRMRINGTGSNEPEKFAAECGTVVWPRQGPDIFALKECNYCNYLDEITQALFSEIGLE
ncbi:hypothetical protein CEXT_223891 [Caerostris extrusa]|uniref:Uncharacterized protein n=1 Tax=Caerostris extrusa TaxID=172846 RepID=A0AAV4MTD4_CAEEX|nr:hypothetical protein CEXT_223891 [Caerostris extrusa]